MTKYYHGVRVIEQETAITTPKEGAAGPQVVFGTAPVNLAKDPYTAANIPKLCYSFTECVQSLGYSDDFERYTLCQSMDTNFNVFAIGPVILVNVLDPKKHVKENAAKQYSVVDKQALVTEEGILLDTLKVKNGESELVKDTDYIADFNEDGYVVVTLLNGDEIQAVSVESKSIDPSMVTKTDVIGGYDADTGEESGIETVRQIYPRFGMAPGMLLAPGWSKDPTVAAVLAAKCENINGVFRCECLIDLDTAKAKRYTDCKQEKEDSGIVDCHAIVLWPKLSIGGSVYDFSAVYGALVAYMDASNDDVPNLYPSNKLLKVTGAVLEDGTEVTLDQEQANTLNGQGIVTALNDSGWKAWGNNTAVYPSSSDPKDRWIGCRRFFSWWGNSFILNYKEKVDDPANRRLIESICDSENVRGNSYVAQGKCAGIRIEFTEEDNPIEGLIDGKIVFRQYLAPYTPAEDISNIISFDPDMLKAALGGE